MADWLTSFRYAARILRRQPAFALIAVLTLALGIGANTALYSIIQAVVLNPLPYDDPERIVVLWEVNPEAVLDRVSVPTFEDWKADIKSLDSIAAYRRADFTFTRSGDPLSVSGVRTTPQLFRVLAAGARLGRTLVPDDGVFGAARVVVLSDAFWRRVLGAEPGIVGRTIQLDAEPYTVVGVMPPAFEFPTAASAQIWTPLAFDPKDLHGRSRRARSLMVVGRVAAGATPAQAQEELRLLSARIAADNRDSNEGWSARVVAAHEQLVAASRPALFMLMGAVGFLLLIVCANMASLFLARLSHRRREIAVRGALGGGRWQIARPILAESLLLSLGGGVLGWLAAGAGLRLLTALPDARLPRMDQIQLDGRVLLFTTVVAIAVAVACGLLPALHASRGELRDNLSDSVANTTTRGARRLLNALVVVEVAMALVLLVGAGLMTRSFTKLLAVNPGFDPGNVIAAQVFLPTTKYRERHRLVQFFEDVVQQVRGAPGVTAASAVSILPMHDVGVASALPFAVEGRQPPRNEDPLADVRIVAPGYFETMKIRLLDGRFLDERDGADNPRTSVINEMMARRYFPEGSPLGQTIVNPHGKSVVVGVVADVRNQGLDSEPRKQVYLPLRQSPTAGMAIVARTERDPAAFAAAIRGAVWSVDADQPIYELSTMDQILARAVFLPRMSATLLGLFAAAALLLAALGIYGILTYTVSQRTREIGLRLALGASGGRAIGLVVRNSLTMLAAGVVLGLVASILAARSIGGVLYGISPFDLPAFTIAAVALCAAGLVATLIPALRAARVDPMIALREP
jgi:putative ABC transport system permease protein